LKQEDGYAAVQSDDGETSSPSATQSSPPVPEQQRRREEGLALQVSSPAGRRTLMDDLLAAIIQLLGVRGPPALVRQETERWCRTNRHCRSNSSATTTSEICSDGGVELPHPRNE